MAAALKNELGADVDVVNGNRGEFTVLVGDHMAQIGRAISVDSRGILEALEKIYRAKALVKELTKSSEKARK